MMLIIFRLEGENPSEKFFQNGTEHLNLGQREENEALIGRPSN